MLILKTRFKGDMAVALEDRINSVVADLRSRMEADLAETTASADLLRQYHYGGEKC